MSSMSTPLPVDPDNPGRGPAILGVAWALTIVCLAFTGVRVYIRSRRPSVLGWDDWLIIVAALIQVVHTGFITEACHWGAGKHDADLTLTQLVNIIKWFWISTTPALLVSVASRISAAILLFNIFGKKMWFKWYLIVFTAFQTIGGIIAIVFIWVQQTPIESIWNPMVEPTYERAADFDNIAAYVAQALFAFADLSYVILPVWIVWRSSMSLRMKIGLGILLSLSLVSFVGSVMKAVTSSIAETQYSSSLVILWAAIEQTLVIAISCVPALRHVVLADVPLLGTIGASINRLIPLDQPRRVSAASLPHSISSQYPDLESAGGGKVYQRGPFVSEDVPVTHRGRSNASIEMNDYIKRND